MKGEGREKVVAPREVAVLVEGWGLEGEREGNEATEYMEVYEMSAGNQSLTALVVDNELDQQT